MIFRSKWGDWYDVASTYLLSDLHITQARRNNKGKLQFRKIKLSSSYSGNITLNQLGNVKYNEKQS